VAHADGPTTPKMLLENNERLELLKDEGHKLHHH